MNSELTKGLIDWLHEITSINDLISHAQISDKTILMTALLSLTDK